MSAEIWVTGFPRIGKKRELKRTLESYWDGKSSIEELQETASSLRKEHWLTQKAKCIDYISCNDFSLYDNMLDTAVMLNVIPSRFKSISNKIERYFAMARGNAGQPAMEMTKWFNTNYHYIVPEFDEDLKLELDLSKILSEYKEAKSLNIIPKINIIGPLTFLRLSKDTAGRNTFFYFESLLAIYKELIRELSWLDKTVYLQIEEPIFVKDPSKKDLQLLEETYQTLSSVNSNVRIVITTYFEHSLEAAEILCNTHVWGIGLDFVSGKENLKALKYLGNKTLVAGIINGRNIWLNNTIQSLELLHTIAQEIDKNKIIISTSCSLLHVPYSLEYEKDSNVKNYLSFASEKLDELSLLGRVFASSKMSPEDKNLIEINSDLFRYRDKSLNRNKAAEINIVNKCTKIQRYGSFYERAIKQSNKLNLPKLPTTTIGSFPQTDELRKLRNDYRKKVISQIEYEEGIRKYIDFCIAFQERIGLDVFVHGEPERNDMVEYFGELLEGFYFTNNGWVQSYGSRCVKPPVIYSDIIRTKPMTVKWISYAQSKTDKPLKGMLTGPVTILNWSFVRDDKPIDEVSGQIAIAIRDEIRDLQEAGIRIVQVDEAAFREGYPLRKQNIAGYEKWAVDNFKLAISSAAEETQIHTHMCYSNFADMIKTIEDMDADVVTIETARGGNNLLNAFKNIGYRKGIGPGVYDIHSQRVPSVEEFLKEISLRMEIFSYQNLWINPDCGLKTRKWKEVEASLSNMVKAVKKIRPIYMYP